MKHSRLNFSILTFICVLLFSCSANKISVRHISMIDDDNEALPGLFYALPQTVITIDVTVSKTDNIRGPYHKYAQKYLGLTNVIQQNSSQYSINNIEISSYVEPDPDHYYHISFPRKLSKNQKILISLSKTGLLKAINDKTEWTEVKAQDYTFTGKEATISSETFNYLVDANIFERIDTIIERIHLDTVTIEKRTLQKSFVEKDKEQRAKEVSEYILKINEKKLDIISGYAEVPYEKSSIAYMYEELEKLENEYLSLFTGVSSTKSNTYRFIYLPKPDEVGQPIHLFNFSETEGILDPFVHKGDEFFLVATQKGTTIPLQKLLLNRPKPNTTGIYYRIPEYGTVSLVSRNKTKAEAHIIINQFGVVNQLNPDNMQLLFFPNSGSIKTIGIEK